MSVVKVNEVDVNKVIMAVLDVIDVDRAWEISRTEPELLRAAVFRALGATTSKRRMGDGPAVAVSGDIYVGNMPAELAARLQVAETPVVFEHDPLPEPIAKAFGVPPLAYTEDGEVRWWREVVKHLTHSEAGAVNAMAHNLEKQDEVFAIQDAIVELREKVRVYCKGKGLPL